MMLSVMTPACTNGPRVASPASGYCAPIHLLLVCVLLVSLSACANGSNITLTPVSTSEPDRAILEYSIDGGGWCDEIRIAASGTVSYLAPCVAAPYTGTVSPEVMRRLAMLVEQFAEETTIIDMQSDAGPIGVMISFHGRGTRVPGHTQFSELQTISVNVINGIRHQKGLQTIGSYPR